MVDFGKSLGKRRVSKSLDPLVIYDNLDRASDKGPIRPAQDAILSNWHQHHRDERDHVVKLHTKIEGQAPISEAKAWKIPGDLYSALIDPNFRLDAF